MPIEFYLLLIFIVVFFPGVIWFTGWWNDKHGADDRGYPIEGWPGHRQPPK